MAALRCGAAFVPCLLLRNWPQPPVPECWAYRQVCRAKCSLQLLPQLWGWDVGEPLVGMSLAGWHSEEEARAASTGPWPGLFPEGRVWLPPALTAAAWAQLFYNLKTAFSAFQSSCSTCVQSFSLGPGNVGYRLPLTCVTDTQVLSQSRYLSACLSSSRCFPLSSPSLSSAMPWRSWSELTVPLPSPHHLQPCCGQGPLVHPMLPEGLCQLEASRGCNLLGCVNSRKGWSVAIVYLIVSICQCQYV